MDNKNIIFNRTIEQYNKRYKNLKYRLLKFTKKEVEEFDRKNGTKNKKLLENKKWWFIDNIYYEIPKPVRFTWFRNLNAGVQTAVCVLGAGVIATSVTLPLVLTNNKEQPIEPEIVISDEVEFDKEKSHIELNKDSYIVLKKKGDKEIADVEEVKVGGKAITKITDWTFDKDEKKVDIKAHAMTSTKIEIKVTTGEPKKRYKATAHTNDETMGTVSGGGDSIEEGTEITFTATPKGSNGFYGWYKESANIELISYEPNLKVKISSDTDIYALFIDHEPVLATYEFYPYDSDDMPIEAEAGTADHYKLFCTNKTLCEKAIVPATTQITGFNEAPVEGFYYKGYYEGCGFSSAKKLKTICFEKSENIKTIDEQAMYNCLELTSFVIPKNVKKINSQAFYRCKKLSCVKFENDSLVSELGSSSFIECSSLENIVLPNSLKKIELCSFQESGLTSFTVPASVEFIEGQQLLLDAHVTADTLFFDDTVKYTVKNSSGATIQEHFQPMKDSTTRATMLSYLNGRGRYNIIKE